ncbi:MAG TPA: MYXO-CTERM sorting domain-containing protein, partial [Myxococcota bacterium]
TLRAGQPGEHIQTFGLVQEGTAWFADSGGPPDTQLAVKVTVSPRDHAGELVDDGFARDADGNVVVEVGATVSGYVDVQNDGHVTWDSTVKLAPTPRDQASAVAASSWLSPTRVAAPDADTPEGGVARFTFEIAGGASEGTVTQAFGLVHEQVTWFADAGYGPADGFFTLTVKTVPKSDPPLGAGEGEGEGEGDDGGGTMGSTDPDGPDESDPNGAAQTGKMLPPSVVEGCSATGASTSSLAGLALALAFVRSRRRR